MGRTLWIVMLTGSLAFWSFGCESDRASQEPGSPPPQENEPGSAEPASPADQNEPGSPEPKDDEPGSQ